MIIINKTGNKYIKQLVEKVIRKVPNKKEYNLDVEIIILDFDLDRVELECCSNECTIRMWNISDISNRKGSEVRWSFFFYTEGVDSPKELANGISKIYFEDDED